MVSFPDPRSRHPFHMHSMIHAQPAYVEEAIDRVWKSDFGKSLSRAHHLVLTGCGTSFHAAMYGAKILQDALGTRSVVEAIHAYDLAFGPFPPGKATVLGVSHSGSTPTTNRALARAKRRGLRVLGVCGLADSIMERVVDRTLVIGSTHDRSWANTMSYTTQLIAFAILAPQQRQGGAAAAPASYRLPPGVRKTLQTEASRNGDTRRTEP